MGGKRFTRRDLSRPPPDAREERHRGLRAPDPDYSHDPLSGGEPDRTAIRCSICRYPIANERAVDTCPHCGHGNFRGRAQDTRR